MRKSRKKRHFTLTFFCLVGGMVAAPNLPLRAVDSNTGDNSQQGDGMDGEETASIDDEAADQKDGWGQSEKTKYDSES